MSRLGRAQVFKPVIKGLNEFIYGPITTYVNSNNASLLLVGQSAAILAATIVQTSTTNLVLAGQSANVQLGLNVTANIGSIIVSGQPVTIFSGTLINCTPAVNVLYGQTTVTANCIQSLPICNNTGTPLTAQNVSWSFFPLGRIGSLGGLTPFEGATTTDSNGQCQTTATHGSGMLFVTILEANATLDNTYVQGF